MLSHIAPQPKALMPIYMTNFLDTSAAREAAHAAAKKIRVENAPQTASVSL